MTHTTQLSNPELRVFKHYFSKLSAAIVQPERLANELYVQDVVSKEVLNETMHIMGTSAYTRTTKLLSAVECPIKLNPAAFHTFVSVLRGEPSLVYLADAMSDEYRKLVYIERRFLSVSVFARNRSGVFR